MATPIPGIHHVTAIAGDPQENIDFYTGVLGLRLVKLTVNFDDPRAYHLYYGDGLGSPGSILTFFAWPGARAGRNGAGQIAATAFSVPPDALEYWQRRLTGCGVEIDARTTRFGEWILAFQDPDGLHLELAGTPGAMGRPYWELGGVPEASAIRGIHGVTLWVHETQLTKRFLIDVLGFDAAGDDGGTLRFAASDGSSGAVADVREMSNLPPGVIAVGNVHHVAWRVPDDATQAQMRQELVRRGISTTPVRDRQYFHSIYFREPGGVLFEIATDGPGFTGDEDVEHLGERLSLPPFLEPRRAEIEAVLPPLELVPQA